jgi:hypothetical protein
MKALKFAVPVAVAVMCVGSVAFADKDSDIYIKNTLTVTKAIDVAVGNSPDCDQNKIFYKTNQSIPGGGTYHLEIKPPRPKFACFRLTGTSAWLKESTKGGKDYTLYIK